MRGTIKKIIATRNFGFIRSSRSTGAVEYFFHRENFTGNWDEMVFDVENGRKVEVEFEEATSNKGPRAQNIKML